MSDSGEPLQSEPVCSFIRKPTKNKNIRKRPVGDDDDDDNENVNSESFTTHKLRKAPKPDNKLHFSSVGSSKKPETEEPTSGHDTAFHFESSKIIQVQHDSRATATLETETEFDRDARAIRERTLKQAEEALKGSMKTEEKLYKGIHGYTDYKAGFRREQTVSGEKAGGSHGPLRASAHIRVSARFDYQPDICKDYKETGYCGFGDACKFMHDRGDYKSGWQLEKEWEEVEKARKRNLALGRDDSDGEGRDESEDEDDDSLPFRCLMCRIHFKEVKNPVVTQCKHYFCEKCALEHHSRNKKCYICNKPTMGIFNIAHEIKKKIAESKQ